MAETRYGGRKTRVGVVVGDKMQKTVVVAVESLKRHRLYRKSIRRVTRYKAHDAEDTCRVGDKVLIVETKPLSKEKRWRVVEVLVTAAIPQEETVAELRELEEEEVVEEAPAAEAEPVEPVPAVAEPAAKSQPPSWKKWPRRRR
jgi:small subunit ribosomal protein S17